MILPLRAALQFERNGHEQSHGKSLAAYDGRLVLPLAEGLHCRHYEERVSGHRPHFHYISLRVDHGIDHNRAADPSLSGEEGIDRVWPKDNSRFLISLADANRTLRRRIDRRCRDNTGKDSTDHATGLSSRNPTRNALARNNGSRQIVSEFLIKRAPQAWKWAFVGWAGTLLAGSQVMKLIMEGVHTIYGDVEKPGFLHRQWRGLVLLLATIAPLLVASLLRCSLA